MPALNWSFGGVGVEAGLVPQVELTGTWVGPVPSQRLVDALARRDNNERMTHAWARCHVMVPCRGAFARAHVHSGDGDGFVGGNLVRKCHGGVLKHG